MYCNDSLVNSPGPTNVELHNCIACVNADLDPRGYPSSKKTLADLDVRSPFLKIWGCVCDRPAGHTYVHTDSDKRIRFCDKILCKVLRYTTLLRSLCRVVTLRAMRSYIGGVSRSERGSTALTQVSARHMVSWVN